MLDVLAPYGHGERNEAAASAQLQSAGLSASLTLLDIFPCEILCSLVAPNPTIAGARGGRREANGR